jgi:hypothetical protein
MIKELTWVDGLGNIHTSKNPSPEFNAISAGLGLTGIITEMTMQLTPPTNTKLITRYLANDTNLFEDIEKMLKARGASAEAMLCCGSGWVGEREAAAGGTRWVVFLGRPRAAKAPGLSACLSAPTCLPPVRSTPPTCWFSGGRTSRCTGNRVLVAWGLGGCPRADAPQTAAI